MVAPLFDAWISFSKTDFTNLCQVNIAYNRTQWQAQADDPNILPGVAASEFEKLDYLLDIVVPPISFGKQLSESRRASSKRYGLAKGQMNQEPELHKILEKDDQQLSPIPSSSQHSSLQNVSNSSFI